MSEEIDDELVTEFTNYRRSILELLDREGPKKVSYIRQEVRFPTTSKDYHLGKLEDDMELIRIVDRVGKNNERKYGLTSKGRHLLKKLREGEARAGRMDELKGRLDAIEARLDALDEQKLDESEHRELVERLRTGYWENIIEEIEARV